MSTVSAALAVLLQASACQPSCTSDEALKVARDTTAATADRARALQVLRANPRREAVPALVALARPYRQPWVVWQGAMRALQAHEWPEAAPFWREMMVFPRRTVREAALRGIAGSGDQTDVLRIRTAIEKETDTLLLRLAGEAERRLQR